MEICSSRPMRYLLLMVVTMVVLLSWYEPLQTISDSYVDDGLKRALVSFASARALNGAISVMQGTEMSFQPMGVGLSMTVGQILQPINELVETFSSIMLAASVAFGVQKLLLSIGSSWVVSVLVSLVACIWALFFVKKGSPLWLSRLLALLLFVRFVMPVITIGGAYVFERFSKSQYEQTQNSLKVAALNFGELSKEQMPEVSKNQEGPVTAPVDGNRADGFFKNIFKIPSISNPVTSVLGAVKGKYENIKNTSEGIVDKIISLIVIFLAQTVLIPLILFWGLYKMILPLVMYSPSPTP